MQHHHLPYVALHQTTEYMICIPSHAQLARKLGFPFDQPAGLKSRRKLGQPHVPRTGKLSADIRKRAVCPDDFSRRCQSDHGRQRRMRHRGMDLPAVNHDIVHQLLHLTAALFFAMQRDHAQNDAQNKANQSINHGKIHSAQGKQEIQHKKHSAACPKCFSRWLLQLLVPLSDAKNHVNYNIAPL